MQENIITIFWIFSNLAQMLLAFFLISLGFRKIFYFLIFMIFVASLLIFSNIQVNWIVFAFAIGGVGCSGIFAIMISELEKELEIVTKKYHKITYLAYIEFMAAWMVGAYYLGEGLTFLHIKTIKILPFVKNLGYYKFVTLLAFLMIIITFFLYFTSFYRKERLKSKL